MLVQLYLGNHAWEIINRILKTVWKVVKSLGTLSKNVKRCLTYTWCPQKCRSFFVWWDWRLIIAKRTVLDSCTYHTTQGDKWDPWLEENKTFSKGKVIDQMKFFNPSFWIVYGNQFINLQYKSTHWFLYSGNTRIKKGN